MIICHRSRETASVWIRQVAQVGVERLVSSYPRHVTVFAITGRSKRGGETGKVTKPIISTYLLLPASRHVILNGLSDLWAGFEPLENMVPQMKLSQKTACIQQQVFQSLLTCRRFRHYDEDFFTKTLIPYNLRIPWLFAVFRKSFQKNSKEHCL